MDYKKYIKSSLIAMLTLGLVACSGNSASNNDSSAIKIGLHYELTGNVADYGNAESKGSHLAIKLANKEAGFEKYKAVEFDNKSDTTEAVTVATSLASENVIGVVGPATSGASAATYQVMDASEISVISPSATQNNVTLQNPDDPTSPVYSHVFRVTFEDAYQGAAMAQFAYENLSSKKTVIYGDSSSDYSKGLIESYTKQFKKLGGEVVATEYYVANDTDFSSVITKLKSLDFDNLYIAGYYNEAGLIIKQAKEAGLDVNITGGDGFNSEVIVDLAGSQNLNKVYFTTGYTTVDASEKLQAFIDAYKEEYKEEPGLFAALAFDATNVLIQASEGLDSQDKAAIRDAIEKIEFKGVTGDFTFDKTHTPIKSVLVVELVDGIQTNAVNISPKQ